MGGRFEAIELQINLNSMPVSLQEAKELIVARNAPSICVDHHTRDVEFHDAAQEFFKIAAHSRLAAGDHEHAEFAAFALQHGLHRAFNLVDAREHFALGSAGWKRGGITRWTFEVAMLRHVEQ